MPEFDRGGSGLLIDQQVGLAPNGEVGLAFDVGAVASAEMPDSHPPIDSATLTVDGIKKACPYFAELAARDPELANKSAEAAIKFREEEAEMRRQGVDEAEIQRQQWAARRERHRERMNSRNAASEKTAPEAAPAPIRRTASEKPASAAAQEPQAGTHPAHQHEAAMSKMPSPSAPASAELIEHPRLIATLPTAPGIQEKEAASVMAVVQTAAANSAPREVTHAPKLPEPPHHEPVEVPPDAATFRLPQERSPADALAELQAAASTLAAEFVPYTDGIVRADETVKLDASTTLEGSASITRDASPAMPQAVSAATRETADQHEPAVEPASVVASFTDALHSTIAVIIAPSPKPEEFAEESDAIAPPSQSIEQQAGVMQQESAPAIAASVAEQLTALDAPEQQAAIAPVLQEIAAEAEAIKNMAETAYIETEVIEMETTQLKELVMELFEQFRRLSDPSNPFEYDPADVEQFVAVLLRRDFRPQEPGQAEADVLDLEHMGTHEVKRYFTQLASMLADMDRGTERTIGNLALFFAPAAHLRSLDMSRLTTFAL